MPAVHDADWMLCPLPVSVSLLTAVLPSKQEGPVHICPIWPSVSAARVQAWTAKPAGPCFITPGPALLLAHCAGPDYKSLGASILLVAAPMGIFFGFVAPTVGPRISWALVAVAGFLFLVAICSLLTTATLDPGFIPREAEDVSSP